MILHTFRQGIHPADDGKAISKDEAIQEFKPTGDAVYPLNQHIGAPAQPIVAVGDAVLVGQPIAQPGGFVSAGICSAVSGKVKAIEPRKTVSGKEALSIVVENDGQFTPVPTMGQERDETAMSNEEILAAIRDAGLVGQGGAGFPTHVKLTMKPGVSPDTVIVNAAECEPYLTSDYRLLMEVPELILRGLRIVLQMFPDAKGVVAIENNKPDAIRLMQEKAKGLDRVSVMPLKVKYPQGGERMLIHAVTGRDICSSKLPIDAGCVVMNVSTAWSIYQAVCLQIPMLTTIMTVTGDAAAKPGNFAVPVGTNHRELLDYTGGFKTEPQKILSGGPMMGMAITDLDVPVTKTSSSILGMSVDEVAAFEPTNCIRCGRCSLACPEFLVPVMMAQAADANDLEAFQKLNGMECIECGCCTYVCPARRRLTQSFKYAKGAVAAERRKAAAAKKAEEAKGGESK